MKAQPYHKVRIFALLLLMVMLLLQCGGGFRSDSPNAVDFQKSLFGKDSIP
jgi:hypothetical protein